MTTLQRPAKTQSPASVSASTTVGSCWPSAADLRILVEHDFISKADLSALEQEARSAGAAVGEVFMRTGLYTLEEVERCVRNHAWIQRPRSVHDGMVTASSAIESYQRSYRDHGFFLIPDFFSREELSAVDLAMHRMVVSHVDANPAKHRVYHHLGGQVLYDQQAFVNIIGHPSLLAIARAFLGEDLVQGKYFVKVEDPYRYAGMFGHTHAETHFDCLNRGLYMFIYMDSTSHDCGGFQIIPNSHRWYSRGPDGTTWYRGEPLKAESDLTNKASLVHDAEPAHRWAGYETLPMTGNSLLVLSPFLWHAVRPVMHRRRLIFTGFFDAAALTRDFVMRSDYFGAFPYDLKACDLRLLTDSQRKLMEIHLGREAWLNQRGR